jgi:hypothetical protein
MVYKLEQIIGKPNGKYVDSNGKEVKPKIVGAPYIVEVFDISSKDDRKNIEAEHISQFHMQNKAYENANAYSLLNINYINNNTKCEIIFRLYKIND